MKNNDLRVGNDTAISVRNLSKKYPLYDSPKHRLKEALHPYRKKYHHDFWALNDISFEVKKGESLGIIGKNGSGKSTLLQILCGVLQKTSGDLIVNGRISALLELGTGFNPEFTGRQNVYLNGVLLGLTRDEIDNKFFEIAEFADIGDFIDQPIKTYSSGMVVRLGFAVQTAVNPDILIVDEALSVGDVFFQQKCFVRVREMLRAGTTLLFVSHDTAAIQNLCDHAILLHHGKVVFKGLPEEAVSRYYTLSQPASNIGPRNIAAGICALSKSADDTFVLEELLNTYDIRREARSEYGAGDLVVEKVAFLDAEGFPLRPFKIGACLSVLLQLHAKREISDPSAGLHLYDRMNNLVFAAGTRQIRMSMPDFAANEKRIVHFSLDLAIQPGDYTLSVGCGQPSDEGPNIGFAQHRLEGLGPITVIPVDNGIWPFYGVARLPLDIKVYNCGTEEKNGATALIMPTMTPDIARKIEITCSLFPAGMEAGGRTVELRVTIKNHSLVWLRGYGEAPIHLAHRWLNNGMEGVSNDYHTWPLKETVPPGECRTVSYPVATPQIHGHHRLRITMVQLGVMRMDEAAGVAEEQEVEIVPGCIRGAKKVEMPCIN